VGVVQAEVLEHLEVQTVEALMALDLVTSASTSPGRAEPVDRAIGAAG
jgi:hypothetical protein